MTKDIFIKAWAREMLSDNLDVMSEAEEFLFDFYNKVILFNKQLEPEGDGDLVKMLSRDISILKEGGYNLARAATNVVENYDGLHRLSLAIAEWHRSVADQGGRGTPPQQPSEGEIDALVKKLRADKTLGINEDKKKIIKAAIKQLLNR